MWENSVGTAREAEVAERKLAGTALALTAARLIGQSPGRPHDSTELEILINGLLLEPFGLGLAPAGSADAPGAWCP